MNTTNSKKLLFAAIAIGALTPSCTQGPAINAPSFPPPPDNAEIRGQLETAMNDGAVAVIVTDLGLSTVPKCKIPGNYRYTAFSTVKTEELEISSTEDLHFALPFRVVNIEASLTKDHHVTLLKAAIGRYDLNVSDSATPFPAACKSATHILRGASLGAFRFVSGDKINAAAHVDTIWAAGAGVGAKIDQSNQILLLEGDKTKCGQSATPQAECKALLALDLEPLNLVNGGFNLPDLYDNTVDAVHYLSQNEPNATSSAEYAARAKKFWLYYWVRLLGVESTAVEQAMIAFGKTLAKCGYDSSDLKSESVPKGFSAACDAHRLKPLADNIEIATAADPRLNRK